MYGISVKNKIKDIGLIISRKYSIFAIQNSVRSSVPDL